MTLTADEEERVRAQVRRWREELVDLSRRNRLLQFGANRGSTFDLRQPGAREIHRRTMAGRAWSIHVPPDPPGPPGPARPPAGDALVTDAADPADLRRGLRNLDLRAAQAFLDTGLWTLHLGFGMLRWRGLDDLEHASSPLLLVPVALERASPRHPYRLRRTEGDPVLNPALDVMLRVDFGIELPGLDDAEGVDLDALFGAVRTACQAWPDWSVEERVALATFSFQKEPMYRDLLGNEDAVIARPAVRALALGGDREGYFSFSPLPDAVLDEAMPPERLSSVLDADAGQRQCIRAGVNGHTFVIDGPPGTGKSQTIANLIAELIGGGQTVLFVSAKAAALDVVHDRLAGAGLGEFLLPLHGHRATRRQVALELGRALVTQPVPGSGLGEDARERLRQRRRALTAYVDAVDERRSPLDRSLQSVYGRVALLHALPRVAPWSGPIAELTAARFDEIMDSARGLAGAWGPIDRGAQFLWRDLTVERFDVALVHTVRGAVRGCGDALAAVRAQADAVAGATGLDWASGADGARALAGVARVLTGRPDVPAHWLARPGPELVRRRVSELRSAWAAVAAGEDDLRDLAGERWPELPESGHEVVGHALEVCAAESVPWLLPGGATGPDTERAAALAKAAGGQAPWIAWRAAWLADAFGGPAGEPSLRRARDLGELGELVATPNRPEAGWLNPAAMPSLRAAVATLSELVAEHRARRAALGPVFTDRVLELDLEALSARFGRLRPGPLRWLRREYRADRRLVASATRGGRADRAAISRLDEALEWQRVRRRLDETARRLAPVVGARGARGVEIDVDALAAAAATAERALRLAGPGFDPAALAAQLAAGGTPDPAVLEAAQDVCTRVEWLTGEAEAVLPDSATALLAQPVADLVAAADRLRPELRAVAAAVTGASAITGRPLTLDETRHALALRARVAAARTLLDEAGPADRAFLGAGYAGGATDWAGLLRALDWSRGLLDLTGPVTADTAGRLLSARADPEVLDGLLVAWDRAAGTLTAQFRREQGDRVRVGLIGSFAAAAALLDRLARSTADIDEWLQHVRRRQELAEAGLEATVADCLRLAVPGAQVAELVERAVLEGWAAGVAEADGRLRDVRGGDRDRLVEEFRELDRELIRRAPAGVIERCGELRPQSTVGQAGIVQAQAALRRRHMPVRRLLAETGEVARRLKPCFMMSPLAVSSLLPPDMRFDVVIFDEASQVRPCEAITAVYRGDRLIVAGDREQLPPASSSESESILDRCRASGIPTLSLRCHYRSRHEALIAFSNANLYGGSLLTFPGAVTEAPDLGVALIRVRGTYRGRPHDDNPVEAAKVAERVLHYADLEPPLSVGVVTFSDAQEECVVRAIESARATRPDLDPFFASDRLNGFFVRNVESVQGDERDVVVLSVGYGPVAGGAFEPRMGALSAAGGQRRLNVAITRARRRVEVVASVGPEDLRGEIREGGGVWLLREYLAYAALGGRPPAAPATTRTGMDGDLEESVARTLRSWGYDVVPGVGTSGHRVDLGVRRPDDPARYLLGVECDGATYHSSPVARDRDRLRHRVLTDLGWSLHRVWSPAWHRDRDGEERRLREALEAAAARAPEIPVRRALAPVEAPVEVRMVEVVGAAEPRPWTERYRVARPQPTRQRRELHAPEAGPDVQRMVVEVVMVEGPVASELVLRRVGQAWGGGGAGARVQASFQRQLDDLRRQGRVRVLGEFVWPASGGLDRVRTPDPSRPETERRVEHIPPQELDIALGHVAAEAVAATADQLTGTVARIFGWHQRGSDIRSVLDGGLARLVGAGRLDRRGDAYLWVGEPLPNQGARRVTDRPASDRAEPLAPVLQLPAPAPRPAAPRLALPDDVERRLTVEGHQRRLRELRLAEEDERRARLRGDAAGAMRAATRLESLRRLLAGVRVLEPPASGAVAAIGCVVSFSEAAGPEETWQLVPPLEADPERGRMSVLSPVGRALYGHAAGDVVEIRTEGGSAPARITAIEAPPARP
jgi:transcription elongation GreA/GreB family factor